MAYVFVSSLQRVLWDDLAVPDDKSGKGGKVGRGQDTGKSGKSGKGKGKGKSDDSGFTQPAHKKSAKVWLQCETIRPDGACCRGHVHLGREIPSHCTECHKPFNVPESHRRFVVNTAPKNAKKVSTPVGAQGQQFDPSALVESLIKKGMTKENAVSTLAESGIKLPKKPATNLLDESHAKCKETSRKVKGIANELHHQELRLVKLDEATATCESKIETLKTKYDEAVKEEDEAKRVHLETIGADTVLNHRANNTFGDQGAAVIGNAFGSLETFDFQSPDPNDLKALFLNLVTESVQNIMQQYMPNQQFNQSAGNHANGAGNGGGLGDGGSNIDDVLEEDDHPVFPDNDVDENDDWLMSGQGGPNGQQGFCQTPETSISRDPNPPITTQLSKKQLKELKERRAKRLTNKSIPGLQKEHLKASQSSSSRRGVEESPNAGNGAQQGGQAASSI